jgi:hypothetical protein
LRYDHPVGCAALDPGNDAEPPDEWVKTARMNWRQQLNTNRCRPSGFITCLPRSCGCSQLRPGKLLEISPAVHYRDTRELTRCSQALAKPRCRDPERGKAQ